jgi:hypothetical protein
MIQTDKGYKLECSGKEIPTYGVYGFSLHDGILRVGHDDKIGDWKEDGFDSGLTAEEKKEIAKHEIVKWCRFGNIVLLTAE